MEKINIKSNKLIYLDCSYNRIKKLDNLPTSLKYLISNNNCISNLDYLPESLEYLDCSCNYENPFSDYAMTDLCSLDNLPNGLIYLISMCNRINQYNNLPKSLKIACLYCNKELDELKNIPIHMEIIDLYWNHLTQDKISDLKNSYAKIKFIISDDDNLLLYKDKI